MAVVLTGFAVGCNDATSSVIESQEAVAESIPGIPASGNRLLDFGRRMQSLRPFEAMTAEGMPVVQWRKFESNFDATSYTLTLLLIIATEPDKPMRGLSGHLKMLDGESVVYDEPLRHQPDVSFKDTASVVLKIDYDDTNANHRAMRFSESLSENKRCLTPFIPVTPFIPAFYSFREVLRKREELP